MGDRHDTRAPTHEPERRYLAVAAAVVLLVGCGGPLDVEPSTLDQAAPPENPTGTIELATVTTGPAADTDGYGIRIDGVAVGWIEPNATRTFDAIPQGDHEVELTHVAPTCELGDANPRAVSVVAHQASSMRFEVECSALPPRSIPEGDIAFVSTRDGGRNPDIYVMASDGSNPRRITNDALWSVDPAWSPDHARIVFNGSGDVHVVGADGSDLRRITSDAWEDFWPAWSPDGTRIAFTRDVTGWFGMEVFVMGVDGSTPLRLTHDHGGSEPTWSPDGTRIAFSSLQDIWVMDADGAHLVNLTNDPGWDMLPAWSPDGSRIAFARGTTEDGVPNVEVYVMDAGGSNVMNLTRHPAQDSSPTWSPDGTRIAFSTNRDGNYEIYVMEADGSRATNLTHHPAADMQPAWWR